MHRNDATKCLRQILDDNNLREWKIKLVSHLNVRTFVGRCSYSDKTIFLNTHHVDSHPDAEIINTIRHEVAHALTPEHGHDEVWREKAKELGCDNTSLTCGLALDARVIDAIRSGMLVEAEVTEEIVRRVDYKITTIHDKCPTCFKVKKEKTSFEFGGKKFLYLQCGHVIVTVLPKENPYDEIVSNNWREEIKNCVHQWDKNTCIKCGEHKMFSYQIDSALAIEKNFGRFGLFHEQGLGKTVIGLSWLKFHPEAYPYLIICKSSLKFQFFKEIVRWMGPLFAPQIIETSKDELLPIFKGYVVSYDLLRRFDLEKFYKLGIKSLILDECQQIKNPDSARTQEVRRLVKECGEFVIPMSGTPWKNRGSEFFVALNILAPDKFYSFEQFKSRWVDYYWNGAKYKEGGIRNIQQFRELTKDILIRKERVEVMPELPLIDRRLQYVEMDKYSKMSYDNETDEFVRDYNQAVIGGEEDSFATSQNILARLAKMRHITGLSKVPATIEFVQEFIDQTDRKIVVFVHHQDVGNIIFNQLDKWCKEQNNGLKEPLKITGEMDSIERFKTQEKFNDSHRILVASTLAAGEGLNLQTCSDCIIHERQWNPANEEQAEGRFIRIGQTAKSVTATYMTADRTVDNILAEIVNDKRVAYNAAMSNEGITWNQSDIIKKLSEGIVRQKGGK